ncbi:dihydrolipoamide acetyltransferase family protein [Caryophanon tenue]|uniref:Dihydrolipoamide acetyltransferase component of pyruvate dehydrogenase complex n=1 Tax=Caryophanon tenue TaxID=33978 RepID=A0A1C0YN97_9BACL|nr:dihydrolipoamide acetyltransferase family protein [Caryophanon tenue]OCS88634.1 branched-chain alpha-keto acid dehydrogenase subunit E2 [Caryophanon tenue]
MKNITMPQLGESVTEGTIERWIVQPGERVEKYDPIAEVQTDKVMAEVPSSFSGIMGEHIAQVGDVVPVGDVICTIDTGEGTTEESAPVPQQTPKPQEQSKQTAVPQAKKAGSHARYSPVVMRLAAEHNIDLQQVVGTGASGRITRNDIKRVIEDGIPVSAPTPAPARAEAVVEQAQTTTSAPQKKITKETLDDNGDTLIPVSSVRRAIAEKMTRSLHEIPHAWMAMEIDVTNLVKYRNEVKDAFYEREGFKLTYLPFFIEAVAKALKKFPLLNSTWEGDVIRQHKDVHISIAVATDDALYVPVIKHADDYSVRGLAKQLNRLTTAVREGTMTMEQMQGGTFTVNNTGAFGSTLSKGIINHPQAAIIQIESINQKPVFIEENVLAGRYMTNLCISIDHRILDGLICGKFLQHVKFLLENFDKQQMSVD